MIIPGIYAKDMMVWRRYDNADVIDWPLRRRQLAIVDEIRMALEQPRDALSPRLTGVIPAEFTDDAPEIGCKILGIDPALLRGERSATSEVISDEGVLQFHFATGDPEPLRLKANDRRFMIEAAEEDLMMSIMGIERHVLVPARRMCRVKSLRKPEPYRGPKVRLNKKSRRSQL